MNRFVLIMCALASCAFQDPGASSTEDMGWPRTYESDGNTVVLYQPQIDRWDRFESIEARLVLSVLQQGQKRRIYGILELTASTEVNRNDNSVLLHDVKRTIAFPDIDEVEANKLIDISKKAIPDRTSMVVSLDRLITYLKVADIQTHEVEVNLEPPPIFYSDKPALLIMFMGEPIFKPIENTKLLFASNTNWDVFLELGSNRYYLLWNESWLTSSDPSAKVWQPVKTLPPAFTKLPDQENWKDVKKHIPGKPVPVVPAVFVSHEPAELIVTEGTPELTPIPGTDLLFAVNTESNLFLHKTDSNYYFLVAGRWFRAKSLTGPWTAATKDLPSTFAQIPADHPAGRLRASIPGTEEAQEAVILASVPQKATVKRSELKLTVVYDGDPTFSSIKGSEGVLYSANTTSTVLKVKGLYYCCENGVWFVSFNPTGPWTICDSVAKEIYTIPSTSPYHNVTYVYVYESTPQVVVVGYTSGYHGAYVSNGLLVFGAGMALGYALADHHHDHWYSWHYHPSHYSYGCGAHFNYYRGGYVRAGRYYGPYGGAGYAARYNPVTGGYARGGYAYGPYGGVGSARAYNPVTGARARAGFVSTPNGWAARGSAYNPRTGRGAATSQRKTPYGSWGRSAVSNGSDWAKFGHRSGRAGVTGGFETSSGAKGVVHRGKSGWTYAGKSASGDVYAGRNGKVYRREGNQGWSTHSNRNQNWSHANMDRTPDRSSPGVSDRRPAATNRSSGSRARTGETARPSQRSTRTQQTNRATHSNSRSSLSNRDVSRQLQRDSRSRARGNKRSSRRSSMSRSRSAPRSRGRRGR